MTGKLAINGSAVDLKPGTVVAITMQVNDIASVDDRQSTFTNTFAVPATQANISLLEYANLMQAQSTVPYRKLTAQYFQNGVQVVKNGFAILNEVGEDFDITLYDGNISFFDLISGLKLSDIDSLTDVMWSLEEAVDSRGNTSGYIWALIDWFESLDSNDREYDVSVAHPCFFLKDVMAAIFEPTGYTLLGDFIESDLYEKLIVPLISSKQAQKYLQSKGVATTDQASDVLGSYLLFQDIVSDPVSDFTSGAETLWQAVGPEWQFYEGYGTGKYSFRFYLNYTTLSDTGYIEIHATGTPIVLRRDDLTASTTGTLEFELRDVSLTHPFVIGVFFKSDGSDPVSITEGSWMECFAADVDTEYGRIFPIAVNLPDFDQKTFIKALMQQFCIIPITNSFKKEVTFVQFSEIVNNKAQAVDWTNKVHMGSKGKISFVQGNYAQTNNLRYLEDDTVRDNYGDGAFSIDDSTLELSKTILTLPYAATEMNIKMGGIVVPEIKEGAKPRILILSPGTFDGDDITWTDGTDTDTPGGTEPLCYFALEGKSNNLKFSDNLISEHYSELVSMLQNFKKVTVAMKLNSIDIDSLDFSIPVYLKQYSAYFYINKISQWIDDSTLCEVELVRLGISAAAGYILTESGIVITTEDGEGLIIE